MASPDTARSAATSLPKLSVIVPVLNEAGTLPAMLERLAPLRRRGAQVIVVDGGSSDGTPEAAVQLVDYVVESFPGRACQMNAGVRLADGDHLLFLHADTILPDQADLLIAGALVRYSWGRFDVRVTGGHFMFPVISTMMNLRSRATAIATGDQAIFMRRSFYDALGGYADQPLMEDIDFSRRARRLSRPACLKGRVSTSGRRWEKHGVWRTILLMWTLRLAYFLGVDAKTLAAAYGYRAQQTKQP